MTDVRASFLAIQQRYGHNIYLQRRENEYTSISTDAEYSKTLETYTVRHMHPGSSVLPGISKEVMEGIIHDSEMIYFFQHDANPSSGDRIYENIELYPSSLSTFLIDKSIPMRAYRGRIEFWACGVSQEGPT